MATNQEFAQYGQQWEQWFQQHPEAKRAAVAQGMPAGGASWEAYGQGVAAFLRSRPDMHQSLLAWGQQPQPQPQSQQPSFLQQYQQPQGGQESEDLDDFLTVRQAREFAQQLLNEQKAQYETVLQAMRYARELDDVRAEELYEHLNFKPTRDPKAIAQYALEHGVNDIRKAYEGWSAPQREQAGYQRGREELEQEYKARGRAPTTQSKSYQRASESQRSQYAPNSQARAQEIMNKAADRAGVPREQPFSREFSKPTPAHESVAVNPSSASGGNSGSQGPSTGGSEAA